MLYMFAHEIMKLSPFKEEWRHESQNFISYLMNSDTYLKLNSCFKSPFGLVNYLWNRMIANAYLNYKLHTVLSVLVYLTHWCNVCALGFRHHTLLGILHSASAYAASTQKVYEWVSNMLLPAFLQFIRQSSNPNTFCKSPIVYNLR